MKFSVCSCILFCLFATGSAFPRPGRPHPLWGYQDPQNDILTLALLMGLDFNEMLTFQAASGRGLNNAGFGNLAALAQLLNGHLPPRAQQQARQDLHTLSVLGLVDGVDVPDGPGGGGGGRGGKQRGGRRGGAARPGRGGAAEGGAAGGEGGGAGAGGEAEGAPAKAANKPRRRGPRRQGPKRG